MTTAATPKKNEIAALGLINWQPMHGYLINQKMQELGLEQWANLSQSSIYYALNRLAKQCAVTVTTEREGKAPERTVYHITAEGRRMLAEQIRRALTKIESDDLLFYLAASFIDALPIAETVPLLEVRAENLREIADLENCHSARPGLPPHLVALCKVGARHMDVERRFCLELIDLFKSQPDYFEKLGVMPDESRTIARRGGTTDET